MGASIQHYIKTFLLWELIKGLRLTGRNLFARKITIRETLVFWPDRQDP